MTKYCEIASITELNECECELLDAMPEALGIHDSLNHTRLMDLFDRDTAPGNTSPGSGKRWKRLITARKSYAFNFHQIKGHCITNSKLKKL